jgi:glutaredoxin-dependent peroxiredoxin
VIRAVNLKSPHKPCLARASHYHVITFSRFHVPAYLTERDDQITVKRAVNLIYKTMALSVGTKAPDFTLKSKQASGLVDVQLSKNFGKKNTLLLFFPAAFTSVCTREMCDISGGLNAYAGLNAEVVGISVDTPFSQEAWAQKENIKITLASDLNKDITRKYDVLLPNLAGIGDTAARAAFVIDQHGVIQYSEQTPTPKELPNFERIKETLGKLK